MGQAEATNEHSTGTMYSRWFNYAVVMLWLTAMGWLVVKKVLPPLRVGEPPSYRTILAAQKRESSVGWRMDFNGQPLGWALSTTSRGPGQVTEIRNHVHFDELPLRELAPAWLRPMLPAARLEMEARSTMIIDPLDRLERFRSEVHLDPLEDAIILEGNVDGNRLKLMVRVGGVSYYTEEYLPADALLGDALSPQTQLPGLRKGQTWTVPVYSPLRPLKSPLEILQATVERMEPVVWGGHAEETWLVVYHREAGSVLGRDRTPRGKLWVRRDGTVLQQQVVIFDSSMTFRRLPDDQAAALAEKVRAETARGQHDRVRRSYPDLRSQSGRGWPDPGGEAG